MKTCTKCKLEKPVDSFNYRADYPSRLHSWCKDCGNAHARSARRWTYPERRKRMKESSEGRYREKTGQLSDFLSGKSCLDCGNTDSRTFEFDHRDRLSKTSNVSAMIHLLRPWSKILKEIELCDILCGNCHKIRTAKQLGYYECLKLIGDHIDNYRR